MPGKTLDQLIGRKGLRLNEVLKYGVQIADALAQAHSAGIIHRDLKPSNVIVSENGQVKVLDFGLAKLIETSTGELEETATMRAQDGPRTEEGAIFGTVAYMAGRRQESRRSQRHRFVRLHAVRDGDWRPGFSRRLENSTLCSIVRDEPKPVSAAADVPRDLEKIINRCLRKDPDRRFQDMGDVKVALQELKEESDSGN